MAWDPLNAEAAVKAAQPMVDEITGAISQALDRVGQTTVTVGPITIPAFTIKIDMPEMAKPVE